jgi:polyhydroxybutyrate depolymerase
MEPAPVRRERTRVLGVVLAVLALPVLLVPIEGVSYFVRHRDNGSIVSGGLSRGYVLHVPPSYNGSRPVPLVISLHGAGLWGAGQQEISRWNAVADREGFIVVYPSGLASGGPRVWRLAGPGLTRDVTFISDLIDKLSVDYNIDRSRIYANGLSNGGGMSFVLSCTIGDRIAAVGMVSAAHLVPWSWCPDRRPMPMVAFHGTADPSTPYAGGRSWITSKPFPHIPTWTANWAQRNRCAPDPVDANVASTVSRRTYTGCADNAPVVLYTIHGGGHDWPGGAPLPEWLSGPPSRGIDATKVMWEFFQAHTR